MIGFRSPSGTLYESAACDAGLLAAMMQDAIEDADLYLERRAVSAEGHRPMVEDGFEMDNSLNEQEV